MDADTVESFGDEWTQFDQQKLNAAEKQTLFDRYFGIFDWQALPESSSGFDMGCGSGRWATLVAPRVGRLYCIDPSEAALEVARRSLANAANVTFLHGGADTSGLPPNSQDFGYSLGVLHHVPDTLGALRSCVDLLKPGAPFLLYLYYRFDNRPVWFRALWRASDSVRGMISKLPPGPKSVTTDVLAATVYWPLARFAKLVEKVGLSAASLPLSFYRESSFYTMRTDSRDRFGTPLEQRFTRAEIEQMMKDAGLRDVRFSDREPFWVAVGTK
jgi:SAM-dependent methyltransferase